MFFFIQEVSFMTVINGCTTSQFAPHLALKHQLRHFLRGPRSTRPACGLAEALLPALRRLLSDEQVTETRFSSFSLPRKARGEGEVQSRGAHVIFCGRDAFLFEFSGCSQQARERANMPKPVSSSLDYVCHVYSHCGIKVVELSK